MMIFSDDPIRGRYIYDSRSASALSLRRYGFIRSSWCGKESTEKYAIEYSEELERKVRKYCDLDVFENGADTWKVRETR